MDTVFSPALQRFIAAAGALSLLLVAVLAPTYLTLLLPGAVVALAALAFYQFPVALAGALVLTYGLALDLQLDQLMSGGGGSGGEGLGAAVVKVVPFAVAGMLLLRYGISSAINWPFMVFVAIAGLSIA